MPLQNRVTPDGMIVADPARGSMMGNRGGVFHRDDQTLKQRHWASKQWICCVLQFKGRHRPVMSPRHYTELFFLDEATALAAGHRPCFECRRADARRFAELWAAVHGGTDRASAPQIDAVLHQQRVSAPRRQPVTMSVEELPDGTFVRACGTLGVLYDGRFLPWTAAGYSSPVAPPAGVVPVITPRAIVSVFAAGYRPTLHASANRDADDHSAR
jgi:hypothetical protein